MFFSGDMKPAVITDGELKVAHEFILLDILTKAALERIRKSRYIRSR